MLILFSFLFGGVENLIISYFIKINVFLYLHEHFGRKENLYEEIVTENVPNLVKETDTQVQEAERPIKDVPKETHAKIHYF